MTSVVCTLFEGNYHYGVAALANSLYASGYRGVIQAGYRGELPPWAREAKQAGDSFEWTAAEGLTLRFIPLSTTIHLTNYKARFLLDLWAGNCRDAERMYYFDPDIVIICRWSFFEEWVEAGVAVCEDINGSMPDNHPIRAAWRRHFKGLGVELPHQFDAYFNGGFVGLTARDRTFVQIWQQVMDAIETSGTHLNSLGVGDRTQMFTCRDQDALNIACMATDAPISAVGHDGMDLQRGGGGYIMSHALGRHKPWNHCYALEALKGRRMSRPTRQFHNYLDGPIRPYGSAALAMKRLDAMLARILGRLVA